MSKLAKGSKWAVGIIGLAGVIVFAAARIRAASSSHPNVVTFSVELGGSGIVAATGYQLEPVVDRNKVVYSLKVTRRLSADTSWVNALQSGAVYNPAVVRVYDSTFAQVNTYSIGNAVVVSVRHTGHAEEPFVTEEIALVGTSLSATAP
jgi:hypothetical protein